MNTAIPHDSFSNGNVVEQIITSLPRTTLQALVKFTGDDADKIKAGIAILVPTILGAIATQSALTSATLPQSSLSKILNSVSELTRSSSSINGDTVKAVDELIKDPTNLLTQLSSVGTPAANTVARLSNELFGDQTNRIFDAISMMSGLKLSSISPLILVAVPQVFSKLSSLSASAGEALNAESLVTVMHKISPSISKSLPLGIGSLLSLGSNLGMGVIGSELSLGSSVFSKTALPSGPTDPRQSSFAPLIALVALIGGAWYLWSSPAITTTRATSDQIAEDTRREAEDRIATAQTLANKTSDNLPRAAREPANEASSSTNEVGSEARAMLGDLRDTVEGVKNEAIPPKVAPIPADSVKLPSDKIIRAHIGSTEEKLVSLLNSTSSGGAQSMWIDFDGLSFSSDSAMITQDSKRQIDNIVAILQAYPTLKIKIGGYTDSTGEKSSNLSLSKARSYAVKAAITSNGIEASRLSHEGYGSSFPVATNKTAEGRMKNRRIALRIIER